MKSIYMKLIVIAAALVLAISVIAVSSYAWLVLSTNPAVEGMEVSIGGGNTILIAPDTSEVVDGKTVHYPGRFSDKLNFGQHPSYAYLSELGGLTPVSTADGIHWFLPTYYDTSDPEVKAGQVPSGSLKNVSEFWADKYLQYANLDASQVERIEEGSYLYLDFWVVSPQGDYTLRISTGDDSSGSFLIEVPAAIPTESGGYTLAETDGSAAACARIGFLVNPNYVEEDVLDAYEQSAAYQDRFTQLRGSYQDENGPVAYLDNTRFTIYEPNGDLHPEIESLTGSYAFTYPVGLVNEIPTAISVANSLTVQKTSQWAADPATGQTQLEQRLQTALLGMTDLADMSLREINLSFYGSYLQGQLTPYVAKADFISRTADLYAHTGSVSATQLEALTTGGATEDVYIVQLEENVPQRIRMFIWLEGQDVDCTDGVDASRIAVNIELAGSNQ